MSRGYNSKSALDLIVSHYQLSKAERVLIYRTVFPYNIAKQRISKTVCKKELKGKNIVIDGFNVSSVVSSALRAELLIEGIDYFIRDLAALTRKVKVDNRQYLATYIILRHLEPLKPHKAIFVFDAQVSRSAYAKVTVEKLLEIFNICGEVVLAKKADKKLMNYAGYIVCSADSLLLDRAASLFDLGGYIARRLKTGKILSMPALIHKESKRVREELYYA